jgi:hypothetical protein
VKKIQDEDKGGKDQLKQKTVSIAERGIPVHMIQENRS